MNHFLIVSHDGSIKNFIKNKKDGANGVLRMNKEWFLPQDFL